MTLLEVGMGAVLGLTIIWGTVIYLLQMIKIEELEEEIRECKIELRGEK